MPSNVSIPKSLRTAWRRVGGLSTPSKMPCFGYSIPAKACHTGSRLAQHAGTVCHNCYALKGRYRFSNVQNAMENRLRSLWTGDWVANMSDLINAMSPDFFRWHDSGDLQGVWHLEKIAEVSRRTPQCKHWLPTREFSIIRQFLSKNTCPGNLAIRVSAPLIDAPPPPNYDLTSTVHRKKPPVGHACPAPQQGNNCGSCRACWDSSIKNVSYEWH